MKAVPCSAAQSLVDQAMQLPPLTIAVVDAGALRVIKGVAEAQERGLIGPLFIGVRQRIETTAAAAGVPLD